jgi:hypothetical protein
MYILKTKGTSKIPDYIQIRDNEFALIAQFKAKSPHRTIFKNGLSKHKEKIMKVIEDVEFGKLTKIDLN